MHFVSKQRHRGRRPTPTRPVRKEPLLAARTNRAQVVFGILSILVVCGLVAAAVATLSWEDLLDSLGVNDPSDEENYQDPNADLISAQQTFVAENPDDLEETLVLANLLGNTGRLPEAIPLFERVLEQRPDDFSARLAFARALGDGGMRADAELQFQTLLEAEPDNQEAHYYLAELYRLWEPARTEEAIVHYRRVTELDVTTFFADLAWQQLGVLTGATPPPGVATPPPGQ